MLLICITILNFAACTGEGGVTLTEDNAGGGDTTVITTAAVESEAPEYVNPEVNYDGETFHFYVYQPSSNWTIAKYNGIISPDGAETGEPVNDAIHRRTMQVEEQLNIKITAATDVGGQTHEEVIKTVLAGDDIYDIIIPRCNAANRFMAEDGILIELGTIKNLDLTKSWWNQNANSEYSVKGKQYMASGDICFYGISSVGTLYTNMKMIDNLALDNPYRLVYDNQWTIDKFDEMCRAASSDLNGDSVAGVEDRFGLGCSNTVAQHMVICSGVRISTKNPEGISEITLNTPKTSTVIDKAIKLLRDKTVALYQPDYTAKFSNVYNEFLLPAFLEERLLFNFNWINIAFEMRSMEADFGLMPYPKYDEAQDIYYSVPSSAWTTLLAVPTTTPKPDRVGNVIQAMGYYSKEIVTPAFIDTTVTTKTLRDNDSANMMQMMFDNMVVDLYDIFTWGKIINSVTQSITKAENTFASDYASMIDSANTGIKTTFDTFG